MPTRADSKSCARAIDALTDRLDAMVEGVAQDAVAAEIEAKFTDVVARQIAAYKSELRDSSPDLDTDQVLGAVHKLSVRVTALEDAAKKLSDRDAALKGAILKMTAGSDHVALRNRVNALEAQATAAK
jgi:hypothetical protein